jgi:hypothetical protein
VVVRYDYVAETPIPWKADLIERLEAFEGGSLRGSAPA